MIEKRTLAADFANQLEFHMKNNLREKRFLLQMYIEKLNGLDKESAGRTSGVGFYYLVGDIADDILRLKGFALEKYVP